MTEGFQSAGLYGILIDDTMPAIEKGIQQLQLYSRTVERGEYIELGLGYQVLDLFFRGVGDQAGMGVLPHQAAEPGAGVLAGYNQRHFQRTEYMAQQPDHHLLIFSHGQISMIQAEAAGTLLAPDFLEREKHRQGGNMLRPEFPAVKLTILFRYGQDRYPVGYLFLVLAQQVA